MNHSPMPLHEPHPGTRARHALGTLVRAASLTLAGCVALAMACTSSGDGTAPSGNAVLPFHVSFGAGVPVATLVVTVTGAGIAPPLVYNMPIVGGGANGSITVPVGAARTILAEAFDTSGVVIFSGSTTVNVVAGTNPTVSFLLTSGVGTIPITAVVGSVTITLAPAGGSVRAGRTLALVPTVRDALGNVVAGPVVTFATDRPPIAWSSAAGVVTGLDAGTATITATSLGAATNAVVIVTAGTALDLFTLSPSTLSAAAGATLTATVTMRDAGAGGIDSVRVTLAPPSGAAPTCIAVAPFTGTRAAGDFRCNLVVPIGVPQGSWTIGSVQAFWNGPTGGNTLFTPSLLNARGVTATVTVTP